MKKIRINELARELEVKAHEILERLPELGVQEKKTHSSSIDEDVAIRLRRLYGFDVPDLEPEAHGGAETAVAEEPEETATRLEDENGLAGHGMMRPQPYPERPRADAVEPPAPGPFGGGTSGAGATAAGPSAGEPAPAAPPPAGPAAVAPTP